jgi:hypothetical protein
MKQIVIMPGGFHPFHAGHYALYKSALEAFPQADVYVAATNDQSERPFPFSIKEKLAKLAGVQQGRFVQVKSPFQAKEITQNYDPNSDVLIFVRSEKDKNESPKPGGTKKDGTPAYFQPYTGKDMQPFSKHAYFAYLPTVTFGPGIKSATEIRNAWPKLDDRRKTAMVMSLYPATQKNPKLAQNVVQLLDVGMGGAEGVAESHQSSKTTEQIKFWYKDAADAVEMAKAAEALNVNGMYDEAIKKYKHQAQISLSKANSLKQGVAEGWGKSIKRASQGWGVGAAPDMVTPSGAVSAFKNMDGQRLANFVASRKDQSKPRKDSAGAFVDKVIDREMRQRGYGRVANKDEQGVAEGYFDDEDDEPPYHTRILDRQTKKVIADDGPYESENEAVDRAEAYLAWAKTKDMSIVAQVYQPEHGKNYVTWQVPDGGDYTVKEQGVAEGAPIVVALPPIDVRNPKKAPQSYRNQGDIVPPTKPPSTEKRGVKGRPGQRPMPTYESLDYLDEK